MRRCKRAGGREVVVSRKAGEAVLRGAPIFVPGVLATSPNISAGKLRLQPHQPASLRSRIHITLHTFSARAQQRAVAGLAPPAEAGTWPTIVVSTCTTQKSPAQQPA